MCDAPANFLEGFREKITGLVHEQMGLSRHKNYVKIGEILVGAGKITPDQLNEALEKQMTMPKKIGEILITMALITQEELQLYLLNQQQLSTISLQPEQVDFSLFAKLGSDFCLAHKIVPIEIQEIRNEKIFRFALLTLDNLADIKNDPRFHKFKLIPYLARKEDVESILNLLQEQKKTVSTIAADDNTANLALLNQILIKALASDVSDIYFRLQKNELKVSYRRHHGIQPLVIELPKQREFFTRVREIAGFSGPMGKNPRKSRLQLSDKFNRFNIRTYNVPGGEEEFIHFKINRLDELEQEVGALPLDEWEQKALNLSLNSGNGLFLICGPLYNRVPETAYALMNTLTAKGEKVASVESTLLMYNNSFFQIELDEREVGLDVYEKLSFLEPDSIFLHDFFNKNYHPKFFSFVESGKLFINCHADSYREIFNHLHEDYEIPSSFFRHHIKLLLFQRLLKLLCPSCKKPDSISASKALKSENLAQNFSLFQAQGCEACYNTGFKDSTRIIELLAINENERKNLSEEDLLEPGVLISQGGGRNLMTKAFYHVIKGETPIEEYQRFF